MVEDNLDDCIDTCYTVTIDVKSLQLAESPQQYINYYLNKLEYESGFKLNRYDIIHRISLLNFMGARVIQIKCEPWKTTVKTI